MQLPKKEEKQDDDEEEKPEDPKKDKGDLKKNPKTADKKAEISKIESVKTNEAFEEFWNAFEELTEKRKEAQGAADPEAIDSKESPKSKEFIAKHGKDEKENDSLSKDNKKGEDATKPKSGKRKADSIHLRSFSARDRREMSPKARPASVNARTSSACWAQDIFSSL